MLLFLDNYDSFTFNLVQVFEVLGAEVKTVRTQAATVDACFGLNPEAIVVGPGPGNPSQAGVSVELIRRCEGRCPLLGVCLGHQALVEAFGGRVVRAGKVMHGKTSLIDHDGEGVFEGLAPGFLATRYHSLVAEPAALPACLKATARSEKGEIMGVEHRSYPYFGVQFHPESVLTKEGVLLLRNFWKLRKISR